MPVRTRPVVALLVVLVSASGPSTARGADEVVVAPGGIVRWMAPGTTRCSLGGDVFEAVDGTCWFPIDLLAEGTLQAGRERSGQCIS